MALPKPDAAAQAIEIIDQQVLAQLRPHVGIVVENSAGLKLSRPEQFSPSGLPSSRARPEIFRHVHVVSNSSKIHVFRETYFPFESFENFSSLATIVVLFIGRGQFQILYLALIQNAEGTETLWVGLVRSLETEDLAM
jgi:hypothetical protein